MNIEKKYIVIIPARGGSKRLPNKNIRLLGDIPLISHTINYVRDNTIIEDIFVTTDNYDIAKISVDYGAKVINRPKELSTDTATTASAMQHAVKEIEQSIDFQFILILQPTNPLRPKSLIKDAINIMETEKCDSLMTVSPLDKKLGKIINNKFIPYNYFFGQRSQDIEPLYYENGLLYISSKELLSSGNIVGEIMFPMIVNHEYGNIDIDTEEDFKLAEYYLSNIK